MIQQIIDKLVTILIVRLLPQAVDDLKDIDPNNPPQEVTQVVDDYISSQTQGSTSP